MRERQKVLLHILKNKNLSKFEKAVYRTVSMIPSGSVRSYKWVAERIGAPKACRAVGNALNKNPYPEIIPCHRVVKEDGSIGGYFKAARIKIRLLRHEGVDCDAKRCYNRMKET